MSRILTPARLAKLQQWPSLTHNWHYLSAAVLNVCNYPTEIAGLYQHAIASVPPQKHAQTTAEFRESILKTAALIGLPRVINALTELKNVTPQELRATELLRQDKADYAKEGSDLFAQVYGKITKRIHYQLAAAYPDLDWFVTKHEYGPLLSYMGVLGPKETSLVICASLIPQDVNPQLKGHLHGALNNGATTKEVNDLRDMAIELAKWCGTTWRSEISRAPEKK